MLGFFGVSGTGPGVGLSDPNGSFPTQQVLRFYDSMSNIQVKTSSRKLTKGQSDPVGINAHELGTLVMHLTHEQQ